METRDKGIICVCFKKKVDVAVKFQFVSVCFIHNSEGGGNRPISKFPV